MKKNATAIHFPLILSLLMLISCVLAVGCARRKPPVPSGPPPVDSAALQARSLEIAREVSQKVPARSSREYEIGPTDVLEISVFEMPKYSKTARVGGDGTIRFPDLGVIPVSGMSERQVEDILQKNLKEKELVGEPQVSVFVKELHAREVTVSGEVKSSGVYPIRGDETLIDAISKAGGLSGSAGNYAYVLRGEKSGAKADAPARPVDSNIKPEQSAEGVTSLKVDLAGLLLRGESQWNIPLQAGDRITIPPVGWVHITGPGVEKAGTYQLRSTPNMLRQSIDDAGGVKFSVDYDFLIIRRNPDGRHETFSVNYKNILEDEKNDIQLQGGDTVIVNRTPVKTALYALGQGAAKVVRISIGFGGYLPLFGNRGYGGYGGGYGY